jgi:arylsulfatase A-like enzyme
VQEDDAKLGSVLAQLARSHATEGLVTVVTSDHGEYFGEHRLVRHDTGLGEPVLHVPLVVHGLAGISPGVVDETVQLADVFPSILQWAGAPVPAGIAGQPLPTSAGPVGASRAIVAEHTSELCSGLAIARDILRRRLRRCGPEDRVWGDARAAIRLPYELLVYDQYPPALFDLSGDRREERDLAGGEPAHVEALRADLDGIVTAAGAPADAPRVEFDPALLERLRALGYVGGRE